MQIIGSGAAAHELPNPTRSRPRDCIWMEPRFRLRQINQVLRHTLFFQYPLNHLSVAPTPRQSAFQRTVSPAGEIVDVSRHLIRHHQRKARVGGFYFSGGLRLQTPIYWIVRDFLRVLDRGRLGLLLRGSLALLNRGRFQLVYAFQYPVKLMLET